MILSDLKARFQADRVTADVPRLDALCAQLTRDMFAISYPKCFEILNWYILTVGHLLTLTTDDLQFGFKPKLGCECDAPLFAWTFTVNSHRRSSMRLLCTSARHLTVSHSKLTETQTGRTTSVVPKKSPSGCNHNQGRVIVIMAPL